ncbi:MAG: response regulator [Marinilabiliaceae bacterium]|nr:response regulator [Marinilabiliaceae bacterium]
MRRFRLKGITNTIQKKVIYGFSTILVILTIVSFLSVRGVRRLDTVIESTESVYVLLDHIYNLRLNEKRVVISGNPELIADVDSLTTHISEVLQKIGNSQINLESKRLLEPMLEHVTAFNKDFKMFASLSVLKQRIEYKVDSIYFELERKEALQLRESVLWLENNKKVYNSVLNEYNITHALLLAIRAHQQRIGRQEGLVYSRDSIEKRFDQVLERTFSIESQVNNLEVREYMSDFRSDVRHFEQDVTRQMDVNENIGQSLLALNQRARFIQESAEKATAIQSAQLKKWSGYSLQSLIGLVVVALVGGIVVLGVFIYNINADIRKRRDVEHAIEDNRRLLDDIINNSKSLIYVKDLDGHYTLVNQNWCEQVGISENQVIGQKSEEIFTDQSVTQWREMDRQVEESGLAVQFEEEIELSSGRRYFLSNKFPIRNKIGGITAICGISTDITEQKNALRDLEKSRENYRNIVTNVPGIVFTGLMDDSRTMIFLSSGFSKVTGFDAGNFLEGVQSFTNLIFENDRERVLNTVKQAVKRNHAYEVEYRIEDVKGEMRWLHEKGMAMQQPDKKGIYLQGVMIDMTAQKEAISEVMMRDRFLEGVAEAVKELIVNQKSDDAILKSLRIVGQSAMVDQSFIFRNNGDENNPAVSHLFEWQKDQIKPVYREDLTDISYQEIGSRWYHMLSDKKEIIGLKDDFVDEEQKLFEYLGLHSLLIVPVFAREVFWGFIGFGNTMKGLPWIESHRTIFRAYTVTLGIAIAKEKDAMLLKDAKNAAEAATRAKSDFLARMSHEIRTPMNAIVGWTHLAIEKESNSGQSDYLRKIQASSKSLLCIINDILDFSKIEAGKLSLENIDFDLEQVFDDLSNMVAYKAHEKGLDFIYAVHADVPLNLIGDPLRLGQILVNLVNNAVKFTNHGEIVTSVLVLKESEKDVELLVEVKDTGIGIKGDLQNHLFDSFSQADVSTTRKYGGTGLGLAICKRLTGLMGGRIWVESEYGEGSSFFFTLKMGKQRVQKRQLLTPPKELKDFRVLLLDQHPATSSILKDMLETLDFQVDLVRDKETALVKIVGGKQEKPVDLVIVDSAIVSLNGLLVAEEIAKHLTNDIPLLVMMPLFGQDKRLLKLIDSNPFIGSIVKPVNYSTLFDATMEALGKEKSKASWRKKEPGLYLSELKKLDDVMVLLVEDNETNKQIGTELLELANVNVKIAANGKEAIKVAQMHGGDFFDLILMDIQMPVMDGFDATREILKLPEYAQTPIVAMTADAIGEAKEKYLKCGMVDMIAKPIDPEQVYKKVLRWVEKYRGIERVKRKSISINKEQPVYQDGERNHLPYIEGINVEEGVRRFANKWDFFKRLLQRFYFDHLEFVNDFNKQKEADREVAERMLHSFKGISGTISAPDLYQLAIQVEADFKNDDPLFSEHFMTMATELETILNELRKNIEVDIEGFEKQTK